MCSTDIVKSELESFIERETGESAVDAIDDVVVSYVTGLVEEFETTSVDMDALRETLVAYVPSLDSCTDDQINLWLSSVVKKLSSHEAGLSQSSLEHCHEVITNTLAATVAANSARNHVTSGDGHVAASPPRDDDDRKRNFALPVQASYDEDSVNALCEMFPALGVHRIQRCLVVAHGDATLAAQMLLQEDGIDVAPPIAPPGATFAHNGGQKCDEGELRRNILQRYGYVSVDDDAKEHRPLIPKTEPKKLIRYRDGRVVSVKGERFSLETAGRSASSGEGGH